MTDWQKIFTNGELIYDKPEEGVILCGDSEKLLARLPDRSVHLIVTSPPYNVGIDYKNHDDRQDYQDYLAKMQRIFTECYRVLVSGGRIAVNLPSCVQQSTYSRAAYVSIDYLLFLRQIGFLDREMVTWLKTPRGEIFDRNTAWGSWQSPHNPYLRDASELILIMSKESQQLKGRKQKIDITDREFLAYSSSVWYMPISSDKTHPAPFPKELPYRIMKLYSYQDNIVLDPFLGSGTTAMVAKDNHRQFIGIDISLEYCKTAALRVSQGILF